MVRVKLVYRDFPSPADVAFGGVTRYDPKSQRIVIMINTVRSEDDQLRTLKHEIAHIMLGHLSDDRIKGEDLSYLDDHPEIEDEANQYADQMTDETLAELVSGLIGETVYL